MRYEPFEAFEFTWRPNPLRPEVPRQADVMVFAPDENAAYVTGLFAVAKTHAAHPVDTDA